MRAKNFVEISNVNCHTQRVSDFAKTKKEKGRGKRLTEHISGKIVCACVTFSNEAKITMFYGMGSNGLPVFSKQIGNIKPLKNGQVNDLTKKVRKHLTRQIGNKKPSWVIN